VSDEPTPPLGSAPDEDVAAVLADVATNLQDAVLSLVAVGRAALDAVERLARDPGPLLDVAGRMAAAGRAATVWNDPRETPGEDADASPSTGVAASRPRVQHIRIEQAEG
jgi:hypothetical protein